VGAFYDAASAVTEATKHHLVHFLIQRFRVAPGPVGTVWVVLYRDIDAVAFVSNSRAEAESTQKAYSSVGLTYEDSIDYWEHPANVVNKGSVQRLEAQSQAHEMYGPSISLEELQAQELAAYEQISRMMQPREDGPLAQVIRENQRITILDCVIERVVPIGGAVRGSVVPNADPAADPDADPAADPATDPAADSAADSADEFESGVAANEVRVATRDEMSAMANT
jgi:hypothetical protein